MTGEASWTRLQASGHTGSEDVEHPAAGYAEAFFLATGLDLGFVREGSEEDFLRSIHSGYCKSMAHAAAEFEACYRFFQTLVERARQAGVEKLVSLSCPFGRTCSAALLCDEPGQRSYLIFGRSLISRSGEPAGSAGGFPVISLEIYQAAMRIVSFSMPLLRRRLRNEYRIPSALLTPVVAMARDFIESNFRRRVSMADIAAAAGVSVSRLSQLYRKEIGMTPHADLARKRLHDAEDQLRGTDKPVLVISAESGHGSISQFNRLFSTCYGLSPGAYRQKLAEGL